MKFLVLLVLFPVLLFAGEIPSYTNEEFFKFLMYALSQVKGASPYLIAALLTELLLKMLGTQMFGFLFKKLKGHVKLTIVLSLSLILGILSGILGGDSWFVAIFNSATVSAFLVLANQIYKQYAEKK